MNFPLSSPFVTAKSIKAGSVGRMRSPWIAVNT
jgi:hypothetical protein